MEPFKMVEFMQPDSDISVLDVGTGSGDTARAVASHVREVVAIDSSIDAIERCRDLNRAAGINNITPLKMDAEKLLFPDEHFDAVTCRLATHHFRDLPQAFQEMARVLKKGAPLVIADRLCPEDRELSAFIHTIGKLRDSTFTTVLTIDQWKQLLESSGLSLTTYSAFKETINVLHWLDRSPLTEDQKQRIYDAFQNASPAVRGYFSVVDKSGRAFEYTDDKVFIRAEKD